jgi:hypothetical protein
VALTAYLFLVEFIDTLLYLMSRAFGLAFVYFDKDKPATLT